VQIFVALPVGIEPKKRNLEEIASDVSVFPDPARPCRCWHPSTESQRFSPAILDLVLSFFLTMRDAAFRIPHECALVEARHKSPLRRKPQVHKIGSFTLAALAELLSPPEGGSHEGS
jgi:hypothetical protein